MTALAKKQGYVSPEEYFVMEETSEIRHEYWHGEIFAMSGGSFNHNIIAMNISSALHQQLKDTNCFVFGAEMKIQLDEALHYAYPDIAVTCGDISFVKDRDDIIVNPILIIEILSKSTGDYDRGGKFAAYRNIDSLRDYVLIDQYKPHVEYFFKDELGRWVLEEFKNMDDSFRIRSVDIETPLKTIYHRVKWAQEE